MKSSKDQKLQEEFDRLLKSPNGNIPNKNDDEDTKIYHALYEALGESPSDELSFGFSENVVQKIELQEAKARHFEELSWFLIPILAFITILGGVFWYYGFNINMGQLPSNEIPQFPQIGIMVKMAAFVGILFVIIQILDSQLIKFRKS